MQETKLANEHINERRSCPEGILQKFLRKPKGNDVDGGKKERT